MKKIIVLLVAMIATMFVCANAQEVKRDGDNFTVEKVLHQSNDVQTKYTFTVNDVVYSIWITKNGRCYIVRTSKNGKQYKQYLAKEICLEICKELNIEYKE